MKEAISRIKKISESKREIELEIPADRVKEEFEKVVLRFAQRAKIKGFRPGKVPRDIVRRMYFSDIKESLINSLVPEVLADELKEQNLKPVASPVVNNLAFKEGQPLSFKAHFEVWPDFSLPDYKSIKVTKKKVSVSEQDIDQSLKELQEKSAQYEPIENRGVVDGDYVVVEVKSLDLKTNKHLPTEKVVVLAGHPENEKTLNENLIGMKSEKEKSFSIHYEKEHSNKKLADKHIEYNIKIHSIKEKKIPEINDDFAKDLGEFGNLKELKAKVKSELLASKENAMNRKLADEIIDKILANSKIELPESLVEQETLVMMRRFLSVQPQKELNKEKVEELKEKMRPRAKKNLQNHLVLTNIAEKEKLEVNEKEITEELKNIARAHNVPLANVIDSVKKEGKKEEIRENLLLQKTVDFLIKCAIIK